MRHPRITTTRQSLQRKLARAAAVLAEASERLEQIEQGCPEIVEAFNAGTIGSISAMRSYPKYPEWRELRTTRSRTQYEVDSLTQRLAALVAVEPDEIKTGDAVLDTLLAGTLTRAGRQRFHSLRVYRKPSMAEGCCPYASAQAVREFEALLDRFKIRPDVRVYCSDADVPSNPFFIGRIPDRLENGQITPDLLGYGDRSVSGRFVGHVVTVYEHGDVHYTVDFTAAQFGYDAFPLIQLLADGVIQRLDAATGEWSEIGALDEAGIERRRDEWFAKQAAATAA